MSTAAQIGDSLHPERRSSAKERLQAVRVGEYEILHHVGTGGMGSVFLAQREIVPGVMRRFAVKVLHKSVSSDHEVEKRLLREAKLAACIVHDNVVAVHEAADDSGEVFLVMEYVHGVTLAELQKLATKRGQRIPLPIIGRVMADALAGLHAAHQARDQDGRELELVHRDFTPQNILVGADGRTKLTDFGIAKAMDGATATVTGAVKGKVRYLAPEQVRGEPLDRRCDIWAAGVVCWELVTGRTLFDGGNDAERLVRIAAGEPPPRASSRRSGLAAEIDDVVAVALARDRRERIQSADDFHRRVEAAWLDGGLAEHSEVARYVQQLAGDALAERDEQIEQVLAARVSQRGAGTVPALAPEASMQPTAVDAAPPRTRAGMLRWRIAAAVAALASGGAVALALAWWPGVTPSRLEPFDWAPPAPTMSASAPVSRPALFRIVADAPISQIVVGKQSFPLRVPSSEVSLPAPDVAERPLTVLVVARDGRRAHAQLEEGADTLTVEFPATTPRPPTPRARRPPPDGPRLAPER